MHCKRHRRYGHQEIEALRGARPAWSARFVLYALSVSTLSACLTLSACGTTEEVEDAGPTLAEEIAAGAEESIPVEAYEYYALDYSVPEGYAAAEGNDSEQAVYYSLTTGDYSYIVYLRRERVASATVETLIDDAETDYAQRLTEMLGSQVTVTAVETQEVEGAHVVRVDFRYTDDDAALEEPRGFSGTEYLYETGKYVFYVVYCGDDGFDWTSAFAQCGSELQLVNVVTERERETE